MSNQDVFFLNPRTCGIYKNGGTRFKTDPSTGHRTDVIDNELIEAVTLYLEGKKSPGANTVKLQDVYERKVLAPTYYDERLNRPIKDMLKKNGLKGITIGDLISEKVLTVRGGHGSPGNDQRTGSIPYVKVSDIRGLRINTNPTNLVTENVAKRFWRGASSGLRPWDLITPNRASSNIGEFAILLPGEEQVVLTKEVFVLRLNPTEKIWDQFYLLWALSLKAVRDQWRRIALMQTNREDCGKRYLEIILPNPKSRNWAEKSSEPFRNYFTIIAKAKETFISKVDNDGFDYVANVISMFSPEPRAEEVEAEDEAHD